MRRVAVLACVVVVATGSELVGYHERVGIPAAATIFRGGNLRIAGGLSSYTGEHPFLAGLVISLTTGHTSVCGGALVDHTHLLTAAQCQWDGSSRASSMTAVLGSVRLFSGGQRVLVRSVTVHPEYDPTILRDDIAVLTIPYIFYTIYIKPIRLPKNMSDTFVGKSAEIIGFGKTSDEAPIVNNQAERDVYVRVIENKECALVFGSVVSDSKLCTSGDGARGPCSGDSGGPLILRYYTGNSDLLIGLVSFGAINGCKAGYPDGYTRITSYMDWIERFL